MLTARRVGEFLLTYRILIVRSLKKQPVGNVGWRQNNADILVGDIGWQDGKLMVLAEHCTQCGRCC
jgi:hypothetical protein